MVADDGYEPDMVLAIARGGLLIGGAIGYALSVKNVYTMNVEFYTGVDERLEVPRILPPAPDFVDLHDARILIVDDVADTGHTLRSVQQFCEGKVAEVRTGVLYEKSHSVVRCDYVWKRTDRGSTSRGATRNPSPSGSGPSATPEPRPTGRSVSGCRRGRSSCSRRTFGVTIPSRRPSRHTVTTGRSGLRRGSTAASSSSGSARARRLNGAISDVSIVHGRCSTGTAHSWSSSTSPSSVAVVAADRHRAGLAEALALPDHRVGVHVACRPRRSRTT